MPDFFHGLPETEASSLTGFARNAIDRRSENRSADAMVKAIADPQARFYLFKADDALLKGAGAIDPLFTLNEAIAFGFAPEHAVLLGWTADGPRLAGVVPDESAVDASAFQSTNLRALAIEGALATDHLGALAQARALCHWHARHRHCAVCGVKTAPTNGGLRRDCPACGAQHFPRTDPVVIMLAVDGERCLLGRQARFAPGMYSCLAGFVEPGETIEDAVRRETAEEAGIRIGRVRYYASQPWPFPMSLMIGCHAEAISTEIDRDADELEDCRWFDRDEVKTMLAKAHPQGKKAPMEMAIAHHIIRAWAVTD